MPFLTDKFRKSLTDSLKEKKAKKSPVSDEAGD